LFHCSAKHGAVVTPWPTSTYFNFTSFRIQIASLYNDPIGKCPEFEQISAQFRQRQFRLVPPFESIVIDFFSFFRPQTSNSKRNRRRTRRLRGHSRSKYRMRLTKRQQVTAQTWRKAEWGKAAPVAGRRGTTNAVSSCRRKRPSD
jgi:hypothetical protein